MKPLVKNAADPVQVKAAGEKVLRGRERDLDDVFTLLKCPQGRRFIWRYLGICGVFQTSFTGNSTTFFNEGQRNIGLKMLADVNEAHPEGYVQMMKESQGENNE